jgi:Bacterial Ig domain/PQQ-like domain
VVYVGGGGLYAFDAAGTINCSGSPKTCAPLWTALIFEDRVVESSPAVANGVVYATATDFFGGSVTRLYAFDAAGSINCSGNPKTCQSLWVSQVGGSFSSPAVSHGAVYVGGDSKLYAFGLEKIRPTTSILVPSNGATLSGTTTLGASASDNVQVSTVQFRLTGGDYNNVLIGVATRSADSWVFDWDTTTVPNGAYTLNSVAVDPANNFGRSADVSITVQN